MRVTYIHQHFATPDDAYGTRSYEMSQRLIAAGHQVTMICGATASAGGDDRVHESNVDGIRVLRVSQSYGNAMGIGARSASFARFAATACRIGSSAPSDLVFATSTPLTVALPGAWGSFRRRVPFVFEVRDLWPELPIAMGLITNPVIANSLRGLERFAYRRADHVIALSPGMKAGIERAGVAADRVELIPNASDVALFQPTDQPVTDPAFGEPSELRVCFPGAHGQANGLDAVLDSLAELKRRGETGIRVILIGDGSMKPQLVQRAEADGLHDYVTFVDPLPKRTLASLLPGFDAGLMTLANVPEFGYGTSPNKFFDFLACGLPVINNYPGWVADLLTEHDCGVVAAPDNPGSLADAFVQLRDRPADRRRQGANARALAETHFDREVLAAKFVDLLERVERSAAQ